VSLGFGDQTLRVIGQHGELITTVLRTSSAKVTRFKAYGIRRSP